MNRIFLSIVFVFALFLSTACAPAATPAPTSAPAATSVPAATSAPAPTSAPRATPTAAPVSLPTVLPTSAAVPDWNAVVQAELNKLQIGQMLFNPPNEMTIGETDRIVARLSQNLAENITQDLQGSGAPQVAPIQVGTFMKARLTGDKFQINALNAEEQIVAGDHFTEWAWDVTPNEAGDQMLHLTFSVVIKIPNVTEASKDYPVMDRKVQVSVTPAYAASKFVGDYWQWIATALGIPAIGWGWKIRADRLRARQGG